MMSSGTESRVGQFRSSVQWFLEGNTPSYKVEQVVELLVCLRVLAAKLREDAAVSSPPKHSLIALATKFELLNRKRLEDTAELKLIVESLRDVASTDPVCADNKPFRDAVVQLIVIAENHLDLPFRRLVIELADSL
jgi:hypothetical protein